MPYRSTFMMSSAPEQKPQWGSSYRLIAADKWKAKSAAMGRDVTQALVQYSGVQPGMKVLDVACGTGEPAISLGRHVGPSGHVTALDLSAELLELASQRAGQRGFVNFCTRQADVHDLPFPDNSFDLVTCRFGVMFFADVHQALAQIHRVLKPDGRACFVAWGPFDQPYWSSTMAIVHRHVGGPLLSPGASGMFRFATPGSLSTELAAAGFRNIEEDLRHLPWRWPGPVEEVWEYARALSTPFQPMLERVPPAQWPQIQAEIYAAIREYQKGDAVEFGVRVVFAAGVK